MSNATFEPPKYLTSLIASISDGAKSAQAAGLSMLAIGLYLSATAFSVTDEDLLYGRTVSISQLGVSLPVSLSYAIAPTLFVSLHVYALMRFGMLLANLEQFLRRLETDVRSAQDRERCRHLLPNIELVLALAATKGSRLSSAFWMSMFIALFIFVPVLVIHLVQISALRYQSDAILWIQRGALIIDLLAILWFGHRYMDTRYGGRATRASLGRQALAWVVCAGLLLFNLRFITNITTDAPANEIHYLNAVFATRIRLQPLDFYLCPRLHWGCRFLQVQDRMLVRTPIDSTTRALLRQGQHDRMKALQGIDGLDLRYRSLRFAIFSRSGLYKASLDRADLQGAVCAKCDLLEISAREAHLERAVFDGSRLEGADFSGSEANQASFAHTSLDGADFGHAIIEGTHFEESILTGVSFFDASLSKSNLSGADLTAADFDAADLAGARLDHADLRGAKFRGANLCNASLLHADLELADLRKVSFRRLSEVYVSIMQMRGRLPPSTVFDFGNPTDADADATATAEKAPSCDVGLPERLVVGHGEFLADPVLFAHLREPPRMMAAQSFEQLQTQFIGSVVQQHPLAAGSIAMSVITGAYRGDPGVRCDILERLQATVAQIPRPERLEPFVSIKELCPKVTLEFLLGL